MEIYTNPKFKTANTNADRLKVVGAIILMTVMGTVLAHGILSAF